MYLFLGGLLLKKVVSLFCPGEARETSRYFQGLFQAVAILLLVYKKIIK